MHHVTVPMHMSSLSQVTQVLLVCYQASQHCSLPYTHQHIFCWSKIPFPPQTSTSFILKRLYMYPCFWGPCYLLPAKWLVPSPSKHAPALLKFCPKQGSTGSKRVEGFLFDGKRKQSLVHTNHVLRPWSTQSLNLSFSFKLNLVWITH